MAGIGQDKIWSRTRSGRVVFLMGLFGLFGLVFWLTTKSRQTLTALPAVVADENFLSFGETWDDPAFSWIVPIRNTTNEDVEIARFATSCSCGKIEPSSLTVPARGTAELHLTLDLRSPQSGPDGSAKDFQVYVQPQITKGPGPQSGWVVHGKVTHPFVIEPLVVDFEESLVRGQAFAPRSTSITCSLDLA